MLVDLPVHEPDATARIFAVHTTMAQIKESAAVRAGALLAGATGWAPPLVASTLARAAGGMRAFNLVVSNVPGPQQPFWLNGCRMLAIDPAVPLSPATQGLTVGIISYDGGVYFGLLADRDLDPPLAVAKAGLVGGACRAVLTRRRRVDRMGRVGCRPPRSQSQQGGAARGRHGTQAERSGER